MATNYDGSVVIRTALETDGFTAGSQDLKRAAQEAANKIDNISAATRASIDKQVRSFGRLNDAYSQQEQQLEALRAEYVALSQTQVESDEYKAVNAEITKLDQQLDVAADKVDKMVALYGQSAVEGNRSFKSLQYDMERMNERYDELIARRTELEETGGAYATADTAAVEKQLAAAEEKHNTTLEKLNDNYLTLRDRINSMGKEGTKAHKAVAKHTGLSFKKVLQYGFGIRSVFVLFRKLRSAAKESLGIMAQYDPQLNGVISKFMTSAKQLKADIGTMIQPLVQKMAPIVTALLDRIHDGIIAISQFFAALVGQNYIEEAEVATVDWAEALDDVADSAEKVEKSLGSYDKLNMISSSAKDEAKATKKNMQLTKDTVKYVKKSLDENKWYVKLGRSLSGVFEKALGWIKKQLEDPEKFLKGLGIAVLATKLGKMLLTGVTNSGFGTGVTGLLPKTVTLAVTAVIGFKIGNYLYNNFEEVRDAANGFIDELLGDPQKKLNTGGKEGKGVLDEFNEAYEKEGTLGIVKQWAKNAGEVLNQSFKIREGSLADIVINKVLNAGSDDIPVRMPKLVIPPLSEEEKTVLAAQNARRIAQAKSLNNAAWLEFNEKVKPLLDNIILKLNVGFEAKFGKTPAQALQELKDKFTNAWNDPGNKLKTAIDTAAQNVKTWWSKIFPDSKTTNFGLAEKMRSLGEKISKSWDTEQKSIEKEVAEIRSDLASLLGDAWTGAITDAFTDGEKKPTGAATGRLGKILSRSGANPFAGLSEEIASRLFTFDGKDAADSLAKGLRGVSTEAEKKGSALYNALQGVGTKISEGINKGTISVPVTFKGQATPTNPGSQVAKVNTTVTITLDGKTISQTVFDEAEKITKQKGFGALAKLHYTLN